MQLLLSCLYILAAGTCCVEVLDELDELRVDVLSIDGSCTCLGNVCLQLIDIIVTTTAFFGYHVKGGALDVGKASTNGVVASSILILFFDVILTKLMLQ